jgi:hypothetical protein
MRRRGVRLDAATPDDNGDTAGDESGMPDGGGECDQELELLSRSDERNGVTAQTVVTEFFGTVQVSLDWMADDEGLETISFTERGTQTVLSLRVETSDNEEVRWYSSGGTGATGCAPRMAIGATLSLETEDGALDETVDRTRPMVTPRRTANAGLCSLVLIGNGAESSLPRPMKLPYRDPSAPSGRRR